MGRKRGDAVLPSYICSAQCRDVRDVKRGMGQVQLVQAKMLGQERVGKFISTRGKLWFVAGAAISPGWGDRKTTTDVTLRRVNVRNLRENRPVHFVQPGCWSDWDETA